MDYPCGSRPRLYVPDEIVVVVVGQTRPDQLKLVLRRPSLAIQVVITVVPHTGIVRGDGAGALSESPDLTRIVYGRDFVALSQQTAHSGRSRARSTSAT